MPMKRDGRVAALSGLVSLAAVLFVAGPLAAADSPAVKSPLSPEESLRRFVLADDELKIELVACEPECVDPVEARFDENGRLWVVEMRDYPNGPQPGQEPLSRIRVLDDRDGDGFYETGTTFAEKLLFPTGLQPWKGGVFVTLAGRVAFMKDTDGDDRADVDETWFTGFAEENPQLRANHPRFGPDGWIYVAGGLRGGKIVQRHGLKDGDPPPAPVDISGRDFRFDPRTGECEAITGNGQFGMAFDAYGNRYICDNRHPIRQVIFEEKYLKLNPNAAVPAVVHDVAPAEAASRVYPISKAWTTSNLHAGQFTAACGLFIYPDDWPASKRDDVLSYCPLAFVCEPTGNLVHAETLSLEHSHGLAELARKENREPDWVREFLASPDEWFRPVNVDMGPDGNVIIVDMYRAVIEHPEWVPDELKHRPDERLGDDRGRIYRIAGKTGKYVRPRRLSLNRAGELVSERRLNSFEEEKLRQIAMEQGDDTAVGYLQSQAVEGDGAALLSLDRMGRVTPAFLARILTRDKETTFGPPDNRACLQVALNHAKESTLAREWILNYPHDRLDVRYVLASGSLGFPWAFDHDRQAIEGSYKGWLARAIHLSVGDQIVPFIKALLSPDRLMQFDGDKTLRDELFPMLIAQLGARARSQEIAEVLTADALRYRLAVELDGTQDISDDDPWDFAGSRANSEIVLTTMIELRRAAVRRGTTLEAQLKDELPQNPALAAYLKRVADCARLIVIERDAKSADAVLVQKAIDLLAFAPFDVAGQTLLKLVGDDARPELQSRAIGALTQHGDASIGPALLSDFSARSPAVRRAILDALLASGERTRLLLAAIENQELPAAELDRARVDRLLKHSDAFIKETANRLFADLVPADREKALAAYQDCLSLKADAARGLAVFKKNCATCHKIGEVGVNVAPDISDSRTKTREQLLLDILLPNKAIDANYVAYSLVTTQGRTLLGVVAEETATSVTLRMPEGKVETLLRSEIEQFTSSGVSLMPEGLEKNIPKQDMADLVSYIKNWRYLDGAVPVDVK